ncbi:MAG: RnfH family protein [Pseudomonadota bacterium]
MDQLAGRRLAVEIACALPSRQAIVAVTVSPGTTAREAVRASGIGVRFPEIQVASAQLGVWGDPVADDYRVADGDRIEVYRSLVIDPRAARRERAALGGTMGPEG